MADWILSHWPLIIQGVMGAAVFLAFTFYLPILWGAPWVPTDSAVVRKMLLLAELKPGQLVVDLGAGDGRIVIMAARKFGARAVGVEIDPVRWLIGNGWIWFFGLRKKAAIMLGDLHQFDLSGADVVTMYLEQGTNQEVKKILEKTLKPGVKIVSHCFSMSGWVPTILDDTNGIFVYELGNTGEEVRTLFR